MLFANVLLFSAVDLLRNEFKHLGPFWWMVWNALLALIPVVLTIVFFKREDQPRTGIRTMTFSLEVILVLLFLPNAPYVATDLVHFLESVRMSDVSLWKLLGTEFPIYATFVLFGLACYSFATDRMLYAIKARTGRRAYFVALFLIPLLSSIGVYLGRVARFNSWDILTDPFGILESSRGAVDQSRMIKVIVSMWLLLIVLHQFYKIVHDGLKVRFAKDPHRNDVGLAKDSSAKVTA